MYILLVDDEEKSRIVLANLLRALGHQVTDCADGRVALELFSAHEFHLVLTDIRMPHMSGLKLLQKIRELQQEIDVILFTGYGDMQTAIEALRLGAYDYLIKPINFQELVAATERVAEHLSLIRENKILTNEFDAAVEAATEETMQELKRLKEAYGRSIGLGPIIFCSDNMTQIIKQAKILHNDRSLPVLVEGETGTGKEVIARLIHFGEGGISTPFVDLNCAAFAPSVFESELFGYEAGAFTGGLPKGQKGKLDLAFGGTLFLDEITEMPIELQAKLLRVLQEKEYYRVGGLKKIKTDVRIICATNVDIEQKVEQGAFRQDLFYRLNVARINLPPLRERREEIISLAEMFLSRFAEEKRKEFKKISKDAAKVLISYNWPGNVRELKNLIERAVVMYDDAQLKTDHLGPLLFRNKINNNTLLKSILLPLNNLPLAKYTDNIILEALKMNHGNKTNTAKYLGMPLRTLYRRLQRYS